MKSPLLPLLCILSLSAASRLEAQTEAARELKQLQEQRDTALASAAEPINRRYLASLESLLRRAIQTNDLETAIKIRAELQKVGMATPTGGAPSTTAGSDEAKRAALRAALRDSKWRGEGKAFELHADGSTTASWHGKKGAWKVTAPGTAEISITNSGAPSTFTFDAEVTTATVGDGKPKREVWKKQAP